MPIALDATYAVDAQPTGVGVYCREILTGLAAFHPGQRFYWAYRPHRYFRSRREPIPRNCRRRFLLDVLPISSQLFHGLNQRLPAWRPRKSVTTFHDLFVMTGEYSSPEFRARFTRLARDAAERSDRIIAVSQFTADQVHSLLNVSRDRLRVVHHGVRVPADVPPVHSRQPVVLSVGAIQRRKNTGRLVAAFRALPEPWRLVLAGAPGYGADELVKDLGPRVEVTGYVSPDQLDHLYRTASIFAFPSLDEGFGIPVLEAMAYGLPVVAANRSSLPEVCGDAAILVDPLNVDQLAAELLRLAGEPDLRIEAGKRGRSRAFNFSWECAVKKTWDVYQELLV